MSTRADSAANGSEPATERSPLLQNGTNGHAGQAESNGADTSTPLAEEPSTTKLLLTLGSCWVGVFLAALGMHSLALIFPARKADL